MITSINKIIGIGKYDRFSSPVYLHKNQVIFGFNGAGKSTLSDIFYSLSDDEHSKKLMERKTLTRDDGSASENPSIEIGTDTGMISFSDEKWSNNQNIYVFNDQYIDDYSTILQGVDMSNAQLVLGREATKLSHKKEDYVTDLNKRLEDINNTIVNNKADCDKIGFGKSRISIKSWTKRITTIANTKLYGESLKESIEKELNDKKVYNANYNAILNWKERINKYHRYHESQAITLIKSVEKTLLEVPVVTNAELEMHIKKCMKQVDVNWLISGMNNMADIKRCPFCGQAVQDDFVKRLSVNLDRYIKGRQKKKSDKIISLLNSVVLYFDEVQLEGIFNDLNSIIRENEEEKILLKKTSNIIDSMMISSNLEPGCFRDICDAIRNKIQNPYHKIVLNSEERKILSSLVKIMKNFAKLNKSLDDELLRIEKRIQTEKEYEKTSALYRASFGDNADIFGKMINDAKQMLALQEKIKDSQRKIDELAECKMLEGINSILEELNVNYRVQAEHKKFYVKISGYERAEYEKNNKILCSEGERRMLAFAYFMQDVYSDNHPKIVVIDDPISSLDLSRKSVVAHKICQLMENDADQIIVLSHDISFVEKIDNLSSSKIESPSYLEIKKSAESFFTPLNIKDYLSTDKEVYEDIIRDGYKTNAYNDRIVALMALRPYTYVMLKPDDNDEVYNDILERSTYFAHSVYSKSRRLSYKEEMYNTSGLRDYCRKVKTATAFSDMNINRLVPDGYIYKGLNYETAWTLYSSFPLDSMKSLRKKALVFRVLLETSLFVLKEKAKFDPEHIGKEYVKAVKTTDTEKKKLFEEIKKLYDISKKYHHGAENGSLLGLSALNPDEMIYFDQRIKEIHDWIIANPTKRNPNECLYSIL